MDDKVLHIGDVVVWVTGHFAILFFLFGALCGSIVWVWNEYMKRFATVQAVHELQKENEEQHDVMVEKMNTQHAEVLKTIINKHSE